MHALLFLLHAAITTLKTASDAITTALWRLNVYCAIMASLMLQKSKVSGVHVHHAKLPDIEYTTKGLSILVPFATTYFCESRFSSIDV